MIKVTVKEKEELLAHCKAIEAILDKYPFFEPSDRYLVTSVNRCKRSSAELLRHVEVLPTQEDT